MRAIPIGSVVAGVLCLAVAAVAAESAPTSAAPAVNWAAIAIAICAATSLGTRILKWCRDNARLLRIIAEFLERSSADPSDDGKGARQVKDVVDRITKREGAGVRDLAEKVAAAAEKKQGKNGGATRARAESKAGRIVRAIGRWAPIVGLFI